MLSVDIGLIGSAADGTPCHVLSVFLVAGSPLCVDF